MEEKKRQTREEILLRLENAKQRKREHIAKLEKELNQELTKAGVIRDVSLVQPESGVVEEIKAKGKEVLPQGARLWLYGSRARGDARHNSDWDLLILLDKPELEFEDYGMVAYPFVRLGWEIGETISAQTYTLDYWRKNIFLPFVKNVERDKIALI